MWLQRRGYVENDFTKETVNKIVGMVRAGDVLLSFESGRWTSMFIRGEWDHAAIVDESLYVVEAVGDNFVNGVNLGGVRRVPIEEWVWKKKHICILRNGDPIIAMGAAHASKRYLGLGYDYSFSMGDEFLYCSELVYICFKEYDEDFLKFIPKTKKILPIDYLKEPNLYCIYNSRLWLNP